MPALVEEHLQQTDVDGGDGVGGDAGAAGFLLKPFASRKAVIARCLVLLVIRRAHHGGNWAAGEEDDEVEKLASCVSKASCAASWSSRALLMRACSAAC